MFVNTQNSKCGATGTIPSATKSNVVLFGGHSGVGMLEAKEIATGKLAASIMTVSKRGRPSAPGLAASFLAAMSQEAVHYMAACDEHDPKAVECLMEWAPPAPMMQVPISPEASDSSFDSLFARIKDGMNALTPLQVEAALSQVKDVRRKILAWKKEAKTQLHNKAYEKDKPKLQEKILELEEKETAALELIADLTAKSNSKSTAE